MQIISRASWGARFPDGFRAAPIPAREVWLHHSVTSGSGAAAVRTLEAVGQSRFAGGISYTFVVDSAGRIYEGHSVGRQGAHTGGRNDISRAICLIGNYETQQMTDQQIRAVAWLLRHGAAHGWWRANQLNGGHRDAPGASTACPGRHAQARIGEINRLAASDDDLEDDDMTPDERTALFEIRDTLRQGLSNSHPPGDIWLALTELRKTSSAVLAALTPGKANQKLPGEMYLEVHRLRTEVAALTATVAALAASGPVDADELIERIKDAIESVEIRLTTEGAA
ncbi:peptidoglycan recognition family protein [Actinoalloteichus sp. GBA129-24]|uniref:peptidoglycan recognition protein family protein n=1 Tax=Actinoalloteichus sp. GBA129-24 TaxID=1612551 RepID=UPI0009504EA5|nr:peptidoglycan recognition family protein [Actinoalloteichus sp. GBA129-24]APU20960.1 N-acetylmuramoyl-L-alanine amidase [Actinoalloteichus sp. GBA129-24]APU24209.1 N-acetylmuramoyl-L-alanine amidase [Actinoalloteichus sp. GBA129-24]